MLVPTLTAPLPEVVALMPSPDVPVMMSAAVVSRAETVPEPLVDAWMPVVPELEAEVVTVTLPPVDEALMPAPLLPKMASAEVTLTVLTPLAVAKMPPLCPVIVPPETSIVTAPAPSAAVPEAVIPRLPLPVTLAPA